MSPRGSAAARFDLVVLGAGTAGLVAAAGAAALGARVALVERRLMGGDCLNFGCVPSKALLRCARAAADVRDAARFGVVVPGGVRVDFGAVMERMRALRDRIGVKDSAERFRGLGVDVRFGEARFVASDAIEVDGRRLEFLRACVATGSRPSVPPVPGLADAGFLTNETVFSIRALPRRLAILGGGPVGCELAQAFARFGSEVHLLQRGERLLPRDDPDAVERVARALAVDGVAIRTSCSPAAVRRGASGTQLEIDGADGRRELEVDALLVAVGRAPNVAGLGLDAAGIDFDEHDGVTVDDRLRTSNPRVYAAGDVCSHRKFTHVADATARIVVRNALFFGRERASALTIPWCTYTDPELAHVGATQAEARERGLDVTTFTVELADVDRALLDGEESGLLRILVRAGSDDIAGATLVARHAGEMISEISAAMAAKVGLDELGRTIHPYPTQAEAIRRAADLRARDRLTPAARRVLGWVLAARRGGRGRAEADPAGATPGA